MRIHPPRWLVGCVIAMTMACTPCLALSAPPPAQPALVMPAATMAHTILNNRARVMQGAVVCIIIGMFILRKTNYR